MSSPTQSSTNPPNNPSFLSRKLSLPISTVTPVEVDFAESLNNLRYDTTIVKDNDKTNQLNNQQALVDHYILKLEEAKRNKLKSAVDRSELIAKRKTLKHDSKCGMFS